MTVSEAPPTFPSPLSRKGTASAASRYIFFFFFFILLSFPSLTQPPAPAAGSQ